jgi:glycosyltransferase involved in cell wall biosynthesis
MKILTYVHGYFPDLNAGAEAMIHQILLDLKNRGHGVAVITENPSVSEYESIPLYKATGGNSEKEIELFNSCDIIFTHLNHTGLVVELGKKYKKNVVHLLHNDYEFRVNYNVMEAAIDSPSSAALIIANSNWVKQTIDNSLTSIVVNPPTKPDRYKVETTREYVTLINLHETKGGNLFWKLASEMKDIKFLGVKGGWGDQIVKKGLPNVTILENTTDIQSVYAKTKILIAPSSYESWGRVGIEASCSGIPVIASPTPGLKESLGDSGIFIDTGHPNEWKKAIISLQNQTIYNKYSKATQKRSEKLAKDFDSQMNLLEKNLLEILYK